MEVTYLVLGVMQEVFEEREGDGSGWKERENQNLKFCFFQNSTRLFEN
jgi:hypothetical protein